MKRLAIAAGLVVVLGAAACSSSTGGAGAPVGINRQSTSPSVSPSRTSTSATPSSSPTTANASTIAPPPRTSSAATTAFATSAPPSTAAPTPTTSGPPVLPQILIVNASSSCGGVTTGVSNGTITLSWTSQGADEVWLLPSQIASVLVGVNAKTSGGKGPYSPNGSASLPGAYSCGDTAGFILVQPYKGGTGSGGIIKLVPRG
jgi:hypothetical protein